MATILRRMRRNRETPISELPATILTTPLDSAIPISYNIGKFRQSESIYGRRHFSLRMRRFGIIYAFSPKSVITVVLRDIDFLLWDGNENFCDLQLFWKFLATFYCSCAEAAISVFPATNMTTPFDSATPIFYKRG